ncbi:hypothetical protein BDV93DRAFT_525900 [Ceratobasidium sp. AG-I]|nr:hypothetical protein BDV93DRAFT_525900 [Ceratobasidium sp. AG-I]
MRLDGKPTGLLDLPPELLYDILHYSASPQFPLINKYMRHTFKYAPPSLRAAYVLRRLHESPDRPLNPLSPHTIINAALAYPMCNTLMIDALERISLSLRALTPLERKRITVFPGRWLFRNLLTQPKPRRRKPGPLSKHSATASLPAIAASASPTFADPRRNPLPFLESLASKYTLSFSARESAFALSMCVRAGVAQYPLLRFLLQAGADPGAQHCLPLQVAATVGNIDAMKMMVEPSEEQDGQEESGGKKVKGGKRRRVEDRVQPSTKVLFAAVKAKHFELAQWLMNEKGVVPDMATLQMMQYG